MLYSTSTMLAFDFDEFATIAEVADAILDLQYIGGSTWTQKALEDAYEQVTTYFG